MTELHLTAPQSWKELSARQLTYISRLMTRRKFTAEEIHTYAFVRFTGIKVIHKKAGYWLCLHQERLFTLSPEQLLSLSRKFSWLTSAVSELSPLPRLKGIPHQEPRLRGRPFAQYLACENYYQAFIHTRNEKHLNCLAAAFYREEDSFNDERTLELAARFAPLPLHLRYTVLLWYSGLKSVFQSRFPCLFQKASPGQDDEEQQIPDMRALFNNMIRALTGGDVTKTNAVYQADTWQALAELNAKAREYKEIEAQMKKYKK